MRGSHIELFAGVGMTGLAAKGFGFKTIATAEVDPWCRKVLEAREPDAWHFNDVRQVRPEHFRNAPLGPIQRPLLVSGGFPCQDISSAGTGAGLSGARSGLWAEFARVIGEFRPEYVLIENSPMLRSRGLNVVLADLHRMGYAARWDCIPAAAVGAPHLRDRIFIVATPQPKEGFGLPTTRELFGPQFGTLNPAKLPRAGIMIDGVVSEQEPQATLKQAKQAILVHKVPCPVTPNGYWPTPAASNPQDGEDPQNWLDRRERLKAKGINGNGAGMPLNIAVALCPGTPTGMWPTPNRRDYKDSGPSQGNRKSPNLGTMVARYPTPTKADGSGGPGTTPKRTGGPNLRTVVAQKDGNGRLNPRWVEWMMGLPTGWTDPERSNVDLRPHVGWDREPGPRTVDSGLKDRTKRIKALGNGLVPQAATVALNMIPELEGAIRS